MSSCSFASFLQFRSNNHHARDGHAVGTSEGPSSSFVAPPLMSPLDLSASGPSPSSNPFSPTGSKCSSSSLGSDSASPHKRHRAHSPDSRVPHHHYLDSNSYPSLASFSSEFGSSFPFSYPGGTITLPSVESVIASPQPTPLPVRSILCTSSSPTSSAVDTPLSSPPPTRPVSRRSSTSKSVRFARCTNASVFPTHSTEEYDRSPIVPTCEAQSLELKRSCSAEGDRDEGGGWIKCVEREKVAAAAQQQLLSANGGGHSSLLPKNAPNLENPVEGVHGLIEGGFFVGEERDQVANAPASVVVTGIPGVGVITEDIELEEEALELEDEMLVDDSAETVDDDDNDEEDVAVPDQDTPRRGSIQDDSASSSSSEEDIELPPSSVDSHQGGGPYGSNSSCASSSTSSIGHMTRGDSASPDMSATTVDEDSGGEDEQERERVVKEEREKVALKKKQRFGLCSLGKYTRQDVFGTYDSLGGF
ncbi:hypothetical protein JCM16303_006116 [Sporobolomyces ruberrimus]